MPDHNMEDSNVRPGASRRRVLGAMGLMAACPFAGLSSPARAETAQGHVTDAPVFRMASPTDTVPAHGLHQAGITTPRPANVDFTYSGNWFERDTSGQGLIFEVNPVAKVFFATWYTYSPTGDTLINPMSQRWYTLQGPYTPGARTVDVTLYETTGGVFDNGTPALTRPVGTAKVQFASCTAATLDYAFTSGTNENLSGQVPLTRVGPTPAGCS